MAFPIYLQNRIHITSIIPFCEHNHSGQALDRLVTVSSMPYGTSTPALSTSSSSSISRPTTIEAFGEISGIGEFKKKKYGKEFVNLIKQFV